MRVKAKVGFLGTMTKTKEFEMAEGTTQNVETTVREIRRHSRKKYSAEEKARIVLEGLQGEVTIAELCRREGIHPNMYYEWSKDS